MFLFKMIRFECKQNTFILKNVTPVIHIYVIFTHRWCKLGNLNKSTSYKKYKQPHLPFKTWFRVIISNFSCAFHYFFSRNLFVTLDFNSRSITVITENSLLLQLHYYIILVLLQVHDNFSRNMLRRGLLYGKCMISN